MAGVAAAGWVAFDLFFRRFGTYTCTVAVEFVFPRPGCMFAPRCLCQGASCTRGGATPRSILFNFFITAALKSRFFKPRRSKLPTLPWLGTLQPLRPKLTMSVPNVVATWRAFCPRWRAIRHRTGSYQQQEAADAATWAACVSTLTLHTPPTRSPNTTNTTNTITTTVIIATIIIVVTDLGCAGTACDAGSKLETSPAPARPSIALKAGLRRCHGASVWLCSSLMLIALASDATPASAGAIDPLELAALVELYSATNGSGWVNNTGWGDYGIEPTDPCVDDWEGVTCSGSTPDHVLYVAVACAAVLVVGGNAFVSLACCRNLRLDGNQLSGSLPASVGALSSLRLFSANSNSLSGSIPTTMSQLSGLSVLDLRSNLLSGMIPAGISTMTGLSMLLLQSNLLSGSLPPEIGQLTSLVSLTANGNQLNGTIPNTISMLTALTHLDMTSNLLIGSIPSGIGALASLTLLRVSSNRLNGTIPEGLSLCISLGYDRSIGSSCSCLGAQ
jgi:hypothetical protein